MTVKEAAKTFDEQRKRCKMMYIFYGIGMIVALAFMLAVSLLLTACGDAEQTH